MSVDYRYTVTSKVFKQPCWLCTEAHDKWVPADTIAWVATEYRLLPTGGEEFRHTKKFTTRALADERVALWVAQRAEEAHRAELAREHVPLDWAVVMTQDELLRVARRALEPEEKTPEQSSGYHIHPVEWGAGLTFALGLLGFAVAKALGW